MFALVGFALVRVLVPGGQRLCRHDLWRAVLGLGLGAGVSSLTLLASLLTGTPQLALEGLLLAALVWRLRRGVECPLCRDSSAQPWDILDGVLAAAFALTFTGAVVMFVRQIYATPHGAWDAWAIHNLHARFLYDATAWRDLFTPLLTWSHPDYPLLVPGFVTSSWALVGADHTAVSAATAFLFTFGSVALLSSSVWLLRDRRQGLLAGLVLLATPSVIGIGAWQVADVPLAWFLLAAIVLLAMDHPAAAGIAAGFAASTKNDGVMLCAALVIGWGLAGQWTIRRQRGFGLGALVPIAVLIWFKLTLAPPNPLVSMANAPERLMDSARHVTILVGFVHHLWTFGGLFTSPILFLVAYVVLMPFQSSHRGTTRAVALTLMLAVCGIWSVYVFATHSPLIELIDGSLDRLLAQLWPTAVFLVFLGVRSTELEPDGAGAAADTRYFSAPRVLGLASLLFLCVLIVLIIDMRQHGPRTQRPAGLPPASGVTRNLQLQPADTLFHVDLVGPVSNPTGRIVSAFGSRPLLVAGWAVDSPHQRLASNVDVVIDGVLYAAEYGIPRNDVATYLKNDVYERSGFEFSMPAHQLEKGAHTVLIRVVASDGTSFVQSDEIDVVID